MRGRNSCCACGGCLKEIIVRLYSIHITTDLVLTLTTGSRRTTAVPPLGLGSGDVLVLAISRTGPRAGNPGPALQTFTVALAP
jgi:hypothetical protein